MGDAAFLSVTGMIDDETETPQHYVDQLSEAGVKRVSTGSSFARAALTGLRNAALELLGPGTATYLDSAISSAEVAAAMAPRLPRDA